MPQRFEIFICYVIKFLLFVKYLITFFLSYKMEISKYLRDHSRTIEGKQQLIIGAFARALEIIPRQLCDNAGFDATDILNNLRMKHAQGILIYFNIISFYYIKKIIIINNNYF